MDAAERTGKIKRAALAGIIGNGVLAVFSIWAGTIGRSAALVGAGIDTATDIISSLITLFAADIADRPPDREHPYGHGRVEAIAAKVLSFIIIFAGAQLLFTSITALIRGEVKEMPAPAVIYVSLVSIGAKIILFLYKRKIGRETESQMVTADAENMRADIILSVSVLAGLVAVRITGAPVIDSFMAAAVAVWIIKNGLTVFMESNDELMEGSGNPEIYKSVFEALKTVEGVSNPHRVRIKKINTKYVIDLDIEVDGRITVNKGHLLAMEAEIAIRRDIKNVYDIMVHVEPGGNCEDQEKYGLNEDNFF